MNESAQAQLFADLASVQDLSTLEHWQRVKLCSDMENAGLCRSPLSGKGYNKKSLAWWKNSKDGRVPAAWYAIQSVHPYASKFISELIDAGKVCEHDVSEFHQKMPPVELRLVSGRVISHPYDVAQIAETELWVPLERIIKSNPFPFRRCDLCKKIFVPASKKQKKFCTRVCAFKAVARTPKRKRYLKTYMRERRKLT